MMYMIMIVNTELHHLIMMIRYWHWIKSLVKFSTCVHIKTIQNSCLTDDNGVSCHRHWSITPIKNKLLMSILDCCPPTMLQMLFQGRLHQKNVTRKVRIISCFRVEQQQETYNILESWTSLAKVLSTRWNKIPVDKKWPENADDIRGTWFFSSQPPNKASWPRKGTTCVSASCCWRWQIEMKTSTRNHRRDMGVVP